MSITLAAALLAAAPAPQTTPIVDTDRTVADQPLTVPPGPIRVVATRTVLPAGATIGTHMHLWARYVYVESGEVQLTLTGAGTTRTFRAGEMIVEPIGKWHSGKIVRDTVLIATEQVPPGRCNTIRPPAAGASNDC
ncbi:MAG TPA: cupin domain-containing protein [Allosphingosinicella sp.]|nr:cupin domain-containing protein [Allosphingosinicella sp.]